MQITRILFRNLGTKLLALGIAVVTWYMLSGDRRERISERSYRIPLSIVNVPRGTMIVSPLPDAMDVRLRGPFTPLRQLEPAKLEAVVDLAGAAAGERRYRLEAGDVNVPPSVEVIAISPAELRIVLDTLAEKYLPIVADLTGEPAAGFRIDDVSIEPRQAKILGPAKVVSRMASVRTEPVSVEGRSASFSATTTLASQAPGVRVREGQVVSVRVRVQPAPQPAPTAARPKRK
ncbi:MAG: CdaR family protein [Thermoanaerobaculia bacterium]